MFLRKHHYFRLLVYLAICSIISTLPGLTIHPAYAFQCYLPHPEPHTQSCLIAQSNVLPGATGTVLVIDVSGSMSDLDASGMAKIDATKKAAGELLTFIGEENALGEIQHQVGIVIFSDSASVIHPLSTDTSSLQAAIETISPSGNTNLGDGLAKALDLLNIAPPQRFIIILSDGIANEGLTTPEEFLAGPVAQARSLNACIFGIGFGEGGEMNFELLRVISEGSGCGNAYLAGDWYELRNAYLRVRYEGMGGQYQEWRGTVQQGEEKFVGEYEVPSNQEVLDLSLLWPGSRLELKIEDPTGTVVTDTYPGVNIVRHSNRMRILISYPNPGKWKVYVKGVEVPGGSTTFTVMGSGRLMIITPTPTPTDTPTFTPTPTLSTPTPTDTLSPTATPTLPPPSTSGTAGLWLIVLGLTVSSVITGVISYSIRRRSRPKVWLEVRLPDGGLHRVPINRLPFRIGSATGNDWVLNDPSVAPHHAVLTYHQGRYFIMSLAGSSGVMINGTNIRTASLANGSQIQIGNTHFTFRYT